MNFELEKLNKQKLILLKEINQLKHEKNILSNFVYSRKKFKYSDYKYCYVYFDSINGEIAGVAHVHFTNISYDYYFELCDYLNLTEGLIFKVNLLNYSVEELF